MKRHCEFLDMLRGTKVRATKDHGQKFQSKLAASFSEIISSTKDGRAGIDNYAEDGGPSVI